MACNGARSTAVSSASCLSPTVATDRADIYDQAEKGSAWNRLTEVGRGRAVLLAVFYVDTVLTDFIFAQENARAIVPVLCLLTLEKKRFFKLNVTRRFVDVVYSNANVRLS